jgi:hypothetical protein
LEEQKLLRVATLWMLTAVIGALVVAPAHSQQPDSVELGFTGDFRGPGPYPVAGGDWFAVVDTSTGMALTATRMEVSEIPAACADTATRITAADVRDPLFLVRGSGSLRAGPIDSVFEERRFIYPAEGLSFQLDSGRWFGFQAYGSAAPAVGEVRVSDYEIRMNQGIRVQTLATFPRIDWDGPPQLVWAGDLDRDGNLDALLDLRASYAANLYTLFLSSHAQSGQLVGKVAEFRVSGC